MPATENQSLKGAAPRIPPADVIKTQLAQIQNSNGFRSARRLKELLAYVVDRTLEGQEGELTEWNIAIAVFGRDDNFDPTGDTIVRTSAWRLREELRRYYETDGCDDPITIELPKGGYVPRFAWRRKQQPDADGEAHDNAQSETDSESASVELLTEPVVRRWQARTAGRLVVWGLSLGLIGGIAGLCWPAIRELLFGMVSASFSCGRMLARVSAEGGSLTKFRLNRPGHIIAATPDGEKVYVANENSHFLSIIHTTTKTVQAIRLPQDGGPMAITRNGRRLYIGSMQGGVAVIDPATDQLIPPVLPIPGPVLGLSLTPDGSKLFIASEHRGLWCLLTRTQTWRQIKDHELVQYVEVDGAGRHLFVSYQGGGPGGRWGHDALEVFDTSTEKSLGVVSGPPLVGGKLVASPDGRLVYADARDACYSLQYDHIGCPAVPSHVFHLLEMPSRRFIKTSEMRPEASAGYFIDSARLFFDGDVLMVTDAIGHSASERWEHGQQILRGVALVADRRQAYLLGVDGKEVVRFDAEPPECSSSLRGVIASFPVDGTLGDVVSGLSLEASGGIRFGPGHVGQALIFNGEGSDLLLSHTPYSRFGRRDSSFIAYVKFSQVRGDMTVLDRTSSDNVDGLRLEKAADQHLALEFHSKEVDAVRLISPLAIVADRWYQVCITKNDESLALYIDGVLQQREELISKRPSNELRDDIPIHMGATKDREHFLNGKLDEIQFYNRALDDAEVRHVYEMRETGVCRIGS